MNIVGIVAEYNPFHNGHAHHIRRSIELTGADGVVCVMSGSFTQRGDIGIVSKWARAEMAVRGGADLVLELPAAFAVRSAYYFAQGAVTALIRTGVVTHLSFGSESGDIERLGIFARLLAEEPAGLSAELKKQLSAGLSFPAARARAVVEYLRNPDQTLPIETDKTLIGPNNILGIEYLRVLYENGAPLIPLTIPRIGAGYHEAGNVAHPSASYLRDQLLGGVGPNDLTGLSPASKGILEAEFSQGRGPYSFDDLAQLIFYVLRTMEPEEYRQLCDVNEGLENRLYQASQSGRLQQLLQNTGTRRYSQTRIRRILIYSLLKLTREAAYRFDASGPLYLRLLGSSPRGKKILHLMRTNSTIPIVTKLGKIRPSRYADPQLREMLALDVLAADIMALLNKYDPSAGIDYVVKPFHLSE